jgi:hypothetical protein
MNIRFLLLIPFFTLFLQAQQTTFGFDPFTIKLDQNRMEVFEGSKNISNFSFRNPSENSVDLDGDSLVEFIIIDEYEENGRQLFVLYIFNTVDTFFLVDSIHSGIVEPFIIYSEEVEDFILITGNSAFVSFLDDEADFLPVNCYKYETGELLQVNDEVYEVFISENDQLLEFIEEYFVANIKNCANSKNIISAIASAYANYINAGEPTLATQLISNYYYCEDKNSFIEKMKDFIQYTNGNTNEN